MGTIEDILVIAALGSLVLSAEGIYEECEAYRFEGAEVSFVDVCSNYYVGTAELIDETNELLYLDFKGIGTFELICTVEPAAAAATV